MTDDVRKNLIISIVSLVFTLILTICLDYLLGWVLPLGLIYPPNSTIFYKTPEFEFTVHINNLGFRGDKISLSPFHQKFRVMTLGDSFTYGWGVNEEDVWSSILSEKLNQKGLPVEFANLGWAGVGPSQYADLSEKVVPFIKPNLIVVAILEGDDLQQLTFQQPQDLPNSSLSDPLNFNILQMIYPNISSRLHQKQVEFDDLLLVKDIQAAWQQQAKKILSNLNSEQTVRFQSLDSEVQQLVRQGQLNPGRIYNAMNTPDRFLEVLDIISPTTESKINQLAFELERIKSVATTYDAKVIVIAVPYGIYVNKYYMEGSHRLGFNVTPEMLVSNAPDETIFLASQKANLKFFSVLEIFRHYQGSEQLYYTLDGHFTVAGNRLLATTLLPIIENELPKN